MSSSKAGVVNAAVPERAISLSRGGTFAGITWKGVALLALMCMINAVRRVSNRIGTEPVDVWVPAAGQSLASGLCVALLVTLAVVATYNRVSPRWRLPALALAILVSTVVGDMLLFTIDTNGKFDFEDFGGWFWVIVGTWPRHALLAVLLTAVFILVRAADDSEAATQRAELDRARYAQQMEEARLQMLQAQIEPHFLFNTLANVRRLYRSDPATAETMLENLMRYLEVALPQMRTADSTLGREAALAESYLGIQRIRMGRRLAYEIDVPKPLRDTVVPPMMLLTLVENAIKHGLSPLPEGGFIRVSADVDDGRLQLRVADSGVGFSGAMAGGGTGLANIQARLATIYGAAAKLGLELNEPRGVTASITMPMAIGPAARPA